MPRTCLACSSPERVAIDKALATGESFRNITKRFSISPAALFRHKKHVAGALAIVQGRREESLGESISEELRRVLGKAWELLNRAESEGDTRGAVVALREVRASLEAIDSMQSKVDEVKQARIVITITRDRETPAICLPERPALDVPSRVVQPERPWEPSSEEASEKILVGPENVAPDRDSYLRALRDVSRVVQPAPRPAWER
jgi:hypothetical protein